MVCYNFNVLTSCCKKKGGNSMKKTRLDHNDRINIQAAIAKNYTLNRTSKILSKSRSTIYREITSNCYYKEGRHSCHHCKNSCDDKKHNFINGRCIKFSAYECPRWKKFPYTCNGCKKTYFCFHMKRFYDCIQADTLSRTKRKESRSFKGITTDHIKTIDLIVTKGVRQGQSIHHIYINNTCLQSICCERTIRRYVYRGYLTVKAHELPRYVRYYHKYEYEKDKIYNVSRMLKRTFADYKNFVEANPDYNIWQYDSVEGKLTDTKAILTITFPKYRFQFGFIINKKSASSVCKKMRLIQNLLGNRFVEIFQINLSDNGPEFSSFHEIEKDKQGNKLCNVFFTNAYRSTDKASCERNHEFIRYVISKGKSLDFLTQEKVNLLFSHINSYTRASNKNKTPYDLMVESFGVEFMDIVGIKRISPNDVCLKPSLLK